jgi:hypothetical protein
MKTLLITALLAVSVTGCARISASEYNTASRYDQQSIEAKHALYADMGMRHNPLYAQRGFENRRLRGDVVGNIIQNNRINGGY